jgi:hypothetical protein
MKTGFSALAAGLLAAASLSAHSAALYSEHWNGGASIQGWVSTTGQAMVVGDASSGQPPGSLGSVLVPDGGANPALAVQSGAIAALEGDFTGHTWTVSFDVRLLAGPVESFALRYHMYDFPHVWYMPLAVPAAGDAWSHVVVQFDADWTDEKAFAAGWLVEGGALATFAQTMSWVTATELRMELEDGATTALMNIDNFVQTPGGSVPEPGTLMLAVLGLAGLGLGRIEWRQSRRGAKARAARAERESPATAH